MLTQLLLPGMRRLRVERIWWRAEGVQVEVLKKREITATQLDHSSHQLIAVHGSLIRFQMLR
jgi:hypothetical protein